MKVPVPGGRVQNLDLLVGQAAAEVLLEQVVRTSNDEVHHLVRGIDHSQAVGGGRIVGLIKVFVDGLEELLFFGSNQKYCRRPGRWRRMRSGGGLWFPAGRPQ